MYIFVLVIGCIVFIAGLYFILAELFKIPPYKYAGIYSNFGKTKANKTKRSEQLTETYAFKLAGFIKLNDIYKDDLKEKLNFLDINESPEMFISKAIVSRIPFIVIGLILILFKQAIGFILLIIGIVGVFNEINSLNKKIKARKQVIESEIPRFLAFITQSLRYSKDVQTIIDNYKNVAGDFYKKELIITIADMKTSSPEKALSNLSQRINSKELDKVLNAIISVTQGDNSVSYLRELSREMNTEEIESLKRKALMIPNKVSRYQLIILLLIVIISLFSMGYSVIDNFKQIFR